MYGVKWGIYAHEEIVSECDGCEKNYKRIDGANICLIHCFPNTK